MRSRLRDRLVVAGTVLLLASLLVAASPLIEHQPTEERDPSDVRIVTPVENGSDRLWPYTSRGRSFSRATLPINVVVTADATTVHRLITAGGANSVLYWSESESRWTTGDSPRGNVSINGTGVYWSDSAGSDRYTYVLTEDGGEWKDATYQVHDGQYFGSRYHLRLYRGGNGSGTWTAIQAHHEHWDWFRLRHDVQSLARAQHYVERDFLDTGIVASMTRERWANGGAIDADGWVTVINLQGVVVRGPPSPMTGSQGPTRDLLVVPLLFVITSINGRGLGSKAIERLGRGRLDGYAVALFTAAATLPLGVRVGAIVAEQSFPAASPVVIGAPFYFLLALGLPAVAHGFGRRLPADVGFMTVVVGMAVGVLLDYAYLGLNAVPFDALVQRAVLLVGLGLIAAGGVRWSADTIVRHRYRLIGYCVWAGALLWPLVGSG